MAVYLLHFSEPYRHAKHYLGWTPDAQLAKRIAAHQAGRGARLCAVVVAAGITLTLARVWEGGDRHLEHTLKGYGGRTKLCPICQGKPHEVG